MPFTGQSQINLKANSWNPSWTPILFANSINLVMRPTVTQSKAIFVTLVGDKESLLNFAKSFYNSQLNNGYTVEDIDGMVLEFSNNIVSFNKDQPFAHETCFDLSSIANKNPRVYVNIRNDGLLIERIECDDPLLALQDFTTWCTERCTMYNLRTIKATCTDLSMSVRYWSFGGQLTEEVKIDG